MKIDFRVVLDTNVILSSHWGNSNSPNREITDRWELGEFDLLYSDDTISEYIEKLIDKGFPETLIKKFVTSVLKLGVSIFIEKYHFVKYPKDPDDIAFFLCAENGDASHLVTYDGHLKEIKINCSSKICEPIPFLQDLREHLK